MNGYFTGDSPEVRKIANDAADKVFAMIGLKPVNQNGHHILDTTYTYQCRLIEADEYRASLGVWVNVMESGACVINVRPMEAVGKGATMMFVHILECDDVNGEAFIPSDQGWRWAPSSTPTGKELAEGYIERVKRTFKVRSETVREKREVASKVATMQNHFKFAPGLSGKPEIKGKRFKLTLGNKPSDLVTISTSVADPKIIEAIVHILDNAQVEAAPAA